MEEGWRRPARVTWLRLEPQLRIDVSGDGNIMVYVINCGNNEKQRGLSSVTTERLLP